MSKRPLAFVRTCEVCPACGRPTVVFLAATESGQAWWRCVNNLCGHVYIGPAPVPFDRLREEREAA